MRNSPLTGLRYGARLTRVRHGSGEQRVTRLRGIHDVTGAKPRTLDDALSEYDHD